MTPQPQLWIDAILSRRERMSALEIIEVEGAWCVLLEDFIPSGGLPATAVFPREQDARDFVARIKSGVSAEDALRLIGKSN